MYSKQEAALLKQEFWTTFGKYMSPVSSAEGEKINWINYKTGVKHVNFKMHADKKIASIGIEMSHADAGMQQLFFDQFVQLRSMLQNALQEEWRWQLHGVDEHGKLLSRIFIELSPVNVFDKQDWPRLISFFKQRIIALDEFWSNAKYGFEGLL